MRFPRRSGILLHVTSLPGPYGIGDLGIHAHGFIEFLSRAGQKLWQVLPLNPTGYGDSPYQCFSAFAGNPLLLDLHSLHRSGFIEASDLRSVPKFPEEQVDYGSVIPWKYSILRRAAANFFRSADESVRRQFATFCEENGAWLNDYALFMVCKDLNNGRAWIDWQPDLRDRDARSLSEIGEAHGAEIGNYKLWQFLFFQQWSDLKSACNQRGIQIMGDIPIYVAHDSAEVWGHPELFVLDEHGNPTVVAGVPPDYFSATGQLWGNPIYRWQHHRDRGYAWWIARFRAALRLFDVVRIDHFRGFQAYWEIPATEPTAVNGRWIAGPGSELFRALRAELGELPIVAENLGVIKPEVEAIRAEFGFPGMSLLQFAFGTDPQGPSFRPHNYVRELVAYTGGHDNDTTVGWWNSGVSADSTRTADDIERERDLARAYLGFRDEPINWVFIRAVLASVADVAMIPLQDVLGLGSDARMNLPGRVSGNWRWRFGEGSLSKDLAERLKVLTALYDR